MRKDERRLLQLIALCTLFGSGNMTQGEKEEMEQLARQTRESVPRPKLTRLCACGCGEFVTKALNKYVVGHSSRRSFRKS